MALHKESPTFEVYVNGKIEERFRLLSCEQWAGGKQLDNATFEVLRFTDYNRFPAFDHIDAYEWTNAEVDVLMTTEKGIKKVLHWGKVVLTNYNYGGRGDPIIVQSRTESHHFGTPITGTPIFSTLIGGTLETGDPFVFNPLIDGQIVGNMLIRPGLTPRFAVADNCIARDPIGFRRLNGSGGVGIWTLRTAAQFLCQYFNSAEKYFKNGVFATLSESTDLLRNVEIPFGVYLPEALDILLTPYGYSWKVAYGKRGDREIVFFPLGLGTKKEVKLQKPNMTADVAKSHLIEADFSVDVSKTLINRVTAIGGHKMVEATIWLSPAWDYAYDSYGNEHHDLLTINNPEWATTPALENVWRKWTLHEAFDAPRSGITDLRPYLGRLNFTHRRRPFEPCIAFDIRENLPLGGRHGMILEYFDPATSTWLSADELIDGTWAPLEREAGIYFNGQHPPGQLIYLADGVGGVNADNVRLRITASLKSDTRLTVTRSKKNSLLDDEKAVVIDAPKRWQWKEIHKSSANRAAIALGVAKSSEVNDTREMREFCDELLNQWSPASAEGTLTLLGVDITEYEVGHTVTGLTDRDVDFRLTDRKDALKRYPSIVGIRFDVTRQATTLSLSSIPAGKDPELMGKRTL